ncbi:MAG: endonuclease [Paenibacillus sp.]|jgi:sugar phosphate isomerase/epimerase|nr:endonuclease [Paenibacillus sp.]
MLHTGLLSVTFRKLSPQEVVSLVVKAGLEGIEWGGDIHVPPGDVQTARQVKQLTAEAGLKVASYGSYYRYGSGHAYKFEDVLESALALGAPTIRIWAGNKGSDAADETWWEEVIRDTREAAELAAEAGVRIAFEFHGQTLTDGLEPALKLLNGINHPNVFIYWQPLPTLDREGYLSDIAALSPWLTNLHVYHITPGLRLPLAEGEADWSKFIAALPPSEERYAMLEFVKDDSPEQFLEDAAVLKRIVDKANART